MQISSFYVQVFFLIFHKEESRECIDKYPHTRYNKSKIMRNAWYLKRANASMTFSACLRKAWRNEKLAVMTAIIENRLMEESKVAEWHPLANVPADYYGNSRTYYGD